MNTERFIDSVGLVREAFVQEAMGGTGLRARPRPARMLRTALIAAAIAALLVVGVYAGSLLVNTPEQAKDAFGRELAAMREMGLLSDELDGELYFNRCTELGANSDRFFPLRVFHKRYMIGAVVIREDGSSGYRIYGALDMATGKLTSLTVQAFADENDEVVRESDGYKFYENYDDIFDTSLTVGRYCDLLAEYWGFSGWTLGSFADGAFDDKYPAPTADTLLKDVPTMSGNYYLPVYFDGDENGAPMYIELIQFPDSVGFMVGTNHALG